MTASLEAVLAKGSFDYVIIGGGTAGLTLAARLSEDPKNTVLVLEAGKDNIEQPDILRPASYNALFANEDFTWIYKLAAQKHAANSEGSWQRGKGLGGSSAINFMCYLKPSADDINDIERLGNPGWTFDHFQRLVRKVEGFIPLRATKSDALADLRDKSNSIGTNGTVKISYPPYDLVNNGLECALVEAYKKNGIPVAPAPYNGDPSGIFLVPNTYDPATHTRSYATTAYYLSARDRPNLTVLTNAVVARILTRKATDGDITATGVEFFHSGKKHIAHVNKEVIVCAGALKSPQILELSGIGDKEVLKKANIPVQVDLRGVGSNVQDHIFHATSFELRDDAPYETLDVLRNPEVAEKHRKLHSSGAGLHTYGMTVFCFVPPDIMSPKAGEIYQSVKQHFLNNWASYSPELQAQYSIEIDRIDRKAAGCESILLRGVAPVTNPPTPGKRYITFFNSLNYALSRGTIHVTSNDPMQDPEYDPHHFEIEADADILVEHVRFSRRMVATSPLKDIIVRELNPGADLQTDDQIRDWVKNRSASIWHTACSCSMLPREIGGVVDTQNKVYGTSNIRVADLSVLPIHVGTHTLSTVYVIAEHAAEVILGNA